VRAEFPILQRTPPVIYLDSASTSLKPRCVLEAIRRYHEEFTANVHRTTHPWGEQATLHYEEARAQVARFLRGRPDEVVLLRNTTEAINLVAMGLGLGREDEILITPLEHHSNQLPWLTRAQVRYLPLTPDGVPDEEALDRVITPRTRLLAVGLLSNVTGLRASTELWRAAAHQHRVPWLLDASQAAGHMPIDVGALGCDFLALSGHKTCGPSGIGALWGRREHLERMAPSLLGGGMVHESHLDTYLLKEAPWCFEAGTPNVEGALGLAAALHFLESLDMERVAEHSRALGARLYEGLAALPHVRLVARGHRDRYGIACFDSHLRGLSAESLARILADGHGILISAGRHCAQPYHDMLGLSATARASTHVYTTAEEVDAFLEAMRKLVA
jgi:cysteine desulfurase/selenocysteine lyase